MDWASGVCGAVTTWKDSVVSATDRLKTGTGGNRVEAAVSEMGATRTLADVLDGLDAPGTDAGREAEAAIDALARQLDQSIQAAKQAGDAAEGKGLTEQLAAVSAISGTLAAMSAAVSRASTSCGRRGPRSRRSRRVRRRRLLRRPAELAAWARAVCRRPRGTGQPPGILRFCARRTPRP